MGLWMVVVVVVVMGLKADQLREASHLPCCYHGNCQVDFLVVG